MLRSTTKANASRIHPIGFPGRRRTTSSPTAANGSVMIPTPFIPVPLGMLAERTRFAATRATNSPRIPSVTGEIRFTT